MGRCPEPRSVFWGGANHVPNYARVTALYVPTRREGSAVYICYLSYISAELVERTYIVTEYGSTYISRCNANHGRPIVPVKTRASGRY